VREREGQGPAAVRGAAGERRRGARRSPRSGLAAALAAALAAVALGAPAAEAVIVYLPGRAISYQAIPAPAGRSGDRKGGGAGGPSAKSQLTYHGGPVMPSNTNYAIYWAPAGTPEYPAGYQSGIDRWFEDLAHDSGGLLNTDSVLTQYGDGAGELAAYSSQFGGALSDTNPYPPNGCSAAPRCLTDAQLRAEIEGFVEAHKLPTDLRHEYFLLTPAGVESCTEAAGKICSDGTSHAKYCAYHSFLETASGVLVYAEDPYVVGMNCDFGEEHPNGNASDAAIGGGLAHEHSESLTDPKLNAWYDGKGNEVADKCRTFKAAGEYGQPLGKAPNGVNYNQAINGDLYYYQQVWSNQVAGCAQRQQQLPAVTKLNPKTGPSAGGTAVTVTGTGFTAAATVRFGAAAASEVTFHSASSLTAVSPPGSAGPVDVTVTTAAGTSPTGAKDQFKYKK
jgi:IPT/TIG domain